MAFGAVLLLHLTGAASAAGAGDEASPGAAKPPLALELNKLEEREGGAGCRVAMVFANRSPAEFDAFRLDLIFFDAAGVIAKRLAVDAAPLRPEKTVVKLFDVAGLPCHGIGQVLVNDVPICRDATGDRGDCAGSLALSSRVAAVPLVK